MTPRRAIGTMALGALVFAACARDDDRSPQPPPEPALAEHRGPRPPVPAQWRGGGSGIPTNQWWSSAIIGPGTQPMWPQPLAAQIRPDGTLLLSRRDPERRPDGTTTTPFIPALRISSEGADQVTVVDSGALHVTIAVSGPAGEAFRVTLAQGSPFAELVARRPLEVTGAKATPVADRRVTFRGDDHVWLLATSQSMAWRASGDALTIEAVPSRPAWAAVTAPPTDAIGDWHDLTEEVARHPLRITGESLTVDRFGRVTQKLTYDRGTKQSVIALLPHQLQFATANAPVLGSFDTAAGRLTVQRRSTLTLNYPAVPVIWNAVAPPGFRPEAFSPAAGAAPEGSYFGGKHAWQLAIAADLDRGSRAAVSALRDQLNALARKTGLLSEWAAVVISPAEFGSDTELNDHSLQYGYWVAAASMLAEIDPAWGRTNQALVDLLIESYAGSVDGQRAPRHRTWSAFEGHSYASGLAPFGDGNNLESSSEAMHAWWAAARWFTVTGRADAAGRYIARLTIESWVSRTRWLPDSAPGGERPWAGVVWSAKSDTGTFFDARPEAALGIKLLPLGPNSLARYADGGAVSAARRRWSWCEANGGCTALWPNLLDSDAAVAGRAPIAATAESEQSTSPNVSAWWRALWAATPEPDASVSCTPGTTARRTGDAHTVVVASNPSTRSVSLSCARGGRTLWSKDLAPGARVWEELRR